jgi:hypothetical protein
MASGNYADSHALHYLVSEKLDLYKAARTEGVNCHDEVMHNILYMYLSLS